METQLFEERHDHTITSSVSSICPTVMPRISNPPHTNIDCVFTTSEEITPVRISTNPETTPYEHTDICTNTTSAEITLLKRLASPEMTYEVPELSEKDIDYLCDVTSVETTPLRPFTKPEVSNQDIGICSNLAFTEITSLGLSMMSESILEVSEHSNQNIDCISDDITPVENDLLRPAEITKRSSELSNYNMNCVSDINSLEITPLRSAETAEYTAEPPKFSNRDIDCISDITSAEAALLGPPTNQESIFEISKLSDQTIDCVFGIASVERAKLFPELPNLSNQNIDSQSMKITLLTPATKLQFAQAASILPYQEIEPHHDTSFSEINPSSNSKIMHPISNQNVEFGSDPTIMDIIPRMPSASLESIRGVCDLSNQESDCVSKMRFIKIAPVESSTNPVPMSSTSEISNYNINLLNSTSDITPVKLPPDLRPTPPFPNLSSQDTESSSPTNYHNHSRRRSPLSRKPVSTSSSLSAPVLHLPKTNSGDDKKGRASINPKQPFIRFSESALHLPTSEQNDARKKNALTAGRLERALNTRMPASSNFRGISVVSNKALAARPRAQSTDQILSTMSEIHEEEIRDSGVHSTTNRPLPRKSAPQRLFGSSRFSGSDLHLPLAEEEEERKSHALAAGRLARAPSVRRLVQLVPKLPDIRMSLHPASSRSKGAFAKANKAQRGATAASCTLAVMPEVEEGEVAAQAECNSISEAEEGVEETVVVIATGPRERPTNAKRRRAIVWRELESISEEDGEEETAATARKDLEEAPIADSEGQGCDLVLETPSPEVGGEKSSGNEPAGTPQPCHTRYQTPSRWSSRIGEMQTTRKPSYSWEAASIPDVSRAEPIPACYSGSPARERERVRYPAPMRWSSRIGEVRAVRTLGYAITGIPFPPPPQAETPEAQEPGAPEGGSDADILLGDLPLFPDLILEAILAPQRAESSSNLGESSGSQGTGAMMGGSIKHRVRAAWKKVEGWGRIGGRAFSGGRG